MSGSSSSDRDTRPDSDPADRSFLDPEIARAGAILTQLATARQILNQRRPPAAVGHAVLEWQFHLARYLADLNHRQDDKANVDTTANDATRVKTMWTILTKVVNDIFADKPADDRRNIKVFLLRLAWHEGFQLKYRRQGLNKLSDGLGPARSFFMVQGNRAGDCCKHAKNFFEKLAAACGKKKEDVEKACAHLKDHKGAGFPKGNLIGECLESHDQFAAYFVAICLSGETIPAADDHGTFWANEWWKGAQNQRDTKAKEFMSDAKGVDPHIPAE